MVGLDLGYEDVRKTRDGFGSCPDMDPETKRVYSLCVGNALTLPRLRLF